MSADRRRRQRVATTLEDVVAEAGALARKLGLSPFDVNYWVVDYSEMNELIAYEGFQRRYPHWRWGMQFDRQQKTDRHLGGKAFEIVNNDSPAHAFLQASNSRADQKAVITHVEAHADFFANNRWFALFDDGLPTGGGTAGGASAGGGTAGADAGDEGEGERDDVSDDGRAGRRGPDAAAMLARHADRIADFMSDPEIDREAVERWIDSVLVLADTIDQHRAFSRATDGDEPIEAEDVPEIDLSSLELSEEVKREVFDEEWLDAQSDDAPVSFPAEPEKDVLGFLARFGKQFDEESGQSTEFERWQRSVLEMLRTEAYYFAPQRMTKVMNEGWAAYWESLMMGEEAFAGDDEFVSYADHQARVLGSPGLNPYALGKQLWEYVENTTNRREVVERLLQVDGITWRTFHDAVDFAQVRSLLEPPEALDAVDPDDLSGVAELPEHLVDQDALASARDGEVDVERYPWKLFTDEGLAWRHYSLGKPQFRGFIERITQTELERIERYLFEPDRYASVEEALADVDYAAGWDAMFEVRESHNDVTFLDEYLTREFVEANEYFTYEYRNTSGDFRVASTDYADVKRKLLLRFTNFGKPTITVRDGNYENRNELLLGHRYNGIMLDIGQAEDVLERAFELWGRPVNLLTIVKKLDDHDLEVARRRDIEPEPEEVGLRLRYDGEEVTREEVDWEAVADLAAEDVDYDTKPEEWLA